MESIKVVVMAGPWTEWLDQYRAVSPRIVPVAAPTPDCLIREIVDAEVLIGRIPREAFLKAKEEEERRVFHVATTRAKDEVYLVVPQVYRGRSRAVIMMKPSRFLTELEEELTEKMELEEGLSHLTVGDNPEGEG